VRLTWTVLVDGGVVSVATVPGPSPQSIASICGEFPDAAMHIQAEDHQASCIELPASTGNPPVTLHKL